MLIAHPLCALYISQCTWALGYGNTWLPVSPRQAQVGLPLLEGSLGPGGQGGGGCMWPGKSSGSSSAWVRSRACWQHLPGGVQQERQMDWTYRPGTGRGQEQPELCPREPPVCWAGGRAFVKAGCAQIASGPFLQPRDGFTTHRQAAALYAPQPPAPSRGRPGSMSVYPVLGC